jgi:hypothetical protein
MTRHLNLVPRKTRPPGIHFSHRNEETATEDFIKTLPNVLVIRPSLDTTQNNSVNIVHKRSTDQSLDLSLSRANEIKISIMSAWVDPIVSHIERTNRVHIFKDHMDQVLS